MRYIKSYNYFVLNEGIGKFKNLLLSSVLSLGLNFSQAQTIQQDSTKKEVVRDISNFNKSVLLSNNKDNEVALSRLVQDLSHNIKDPNYFINNYLRFQQNGTIVVKSDFMHGLELHLNKARFDINYNIKF